MSEDGFVFEGTYLDVEIYRLLSFVAASEVLLNWSSVDDDQVMAGVNWHRRAEITEISRVLVTIAIIIRDKVPNEPGPSEQNDSKYYVGFLKENSASLSSDNILSLPRLWLREACNKIINANDVCMKNGKNDDPSLSVNRIFILRGSKNKKPWVAALDVVAFATTASRFV